MAAPSSVFTISRAAEILAEDEDWLHDIALEMEPEDGCLTVWGTSDLSTTAFTPDGIENLRQLVIEHKKLRAALVPPAQ
jgi:hypothetical protein